MASGSFTGTTSNSLIIPKITWSSIVNIANNYSDVTATLSYSRTNNYETSGTWSGSITINGVSVSGSKRIEISLNSNSVAISNTVRVYHNDNGSKSITISATGSVSNTSLDKTTISKTVTLDAIARGSTITSASNATLGESSVIKWTPASSSFYYKIKLTLSDWSWTSDVIHPNSVSEYVYTTPVLELNIAEQLTSATNGVMTAYLYTYSDSSCTTKVGSTSSKAFTVYIPTSMIPTVSNMTINVVNTNPIIDKWGVYVKGHSKAQINCVADGVYGSIIKSYTLSGEYSGTVTSMPYTGGVIRSSGGITFDCIAKDSRGRSSEKVSQNITAYDYYSPSVTSFIVDRSSTDTSKVVVQVAYDYATVGNYNTATATLYYKEFSSGVWTNYGVIEQNTPVTLDATFFETTSYNFRVIVADSLSESAQEELYISTRKVTIDFPSGGNGFGIGKICEKDGSLEVGFDADFYKDIYIHNEDGTSEELFDIVDGHIANEIGSIESAIKNAMNNMFGTAYNLEADVVAGDKWTINSYTVVLTGNNLRLGLNAVRSEEVSGNIKNEVVISYTINHGGRIKQAWNMNSVNRESGCVAAFSTANISVLENTMTIDVMLTATASSLTETSSLISVPVILNIDAYF